MKYLQALILMFFVLGSIADAQVMDYGTQIPKLEESTEVAGIESYRMIREAKDVSVEVFGPEHRLLADCEMEITEARLVIECTLAADGKRYRSTYHRKNETARFEDLDTGDYIVVRYSHPARNREIIHLEPGKALPRSRGTWLTKGTKTKEEAERDWGHAMPLLRLTAAEVEATLISSNGKSAPATRTPAERILNCADPFCNSLTAVTGEGLELLSMNACCIEASQDADIGCKLHTGITCCANSICEGTCFILCSCDLFGFLFDCPNCV